MKISKTMTAERETKHKQDPSSVGPVCLHVALCATSGAREVLWALLSPFKCKQSSCLAWLRVTERLTKQDSPVTQFLISSASKVMSSSQSTLGTVTPGLRLGFASLLGMKQRKQKVKENICFLWGKKIKPQFLLGVPQLLHS